MGMTTATTLGAKANVVAKDHTPEELGDLLASNVNAPAVRAALKRRGCTEAGKMEQRLARLFKAIAKETA